MSRLWYQLISWKPKESTHGSPFDEIKTKLLVFGSKPQIHEGFSWIHKEITGIQLTHISIKEWNFLVVRSVSLNILIIVVVRWFPSKMSSFHLLDFTYNLLTFFTKLLIFIMSLYTKLKELSPSEDYVVDVVAAIVVMVVTVSPISYQTRVCQGSNTNWCCGSKKKSTHNSPFDGIKTKL